MTNSFRIGFLATGWLALSSVLLGQSSQVAEPPARTTSAGQQTVARPLNVEKGSGNVARIRMTDEPSPSARADGSPKEIPALPPPRTTPTAPAQSPRLARIPSGEPIPANAGDDSAVRLANFVEEQDPGANFDDLLRFPESRPNVKITDENPTRGSIKISDPGFNLPSPLDQNARSPRAQPTPAQRASTSRTTGSLRQDPPPRQDPTAPTPLLDYSAPPTRGTPPSSTDQIEPDPAYQPFTPEQFRSMLPPPVPESPGTSHRFEETKSLPTLPPPSSPRQTIGDTFFDSSSVLANGPEDSYDSGNPYHNVCGDVCSDMFYASAFVGYNTMNDFAFSNLAAGPMTGKSGAMAGVNLGIHHGPNLRAEYELAYRSNEIESEMPYFTGPANGGGQLTGDIRVFSGMSNLIWDINNLNVFGVRPYVGAGIGFARFDQDFVWQGMSLLTNDSKHDSSFAYQFLVGLNGNVGGNTDWFLEYRYFNGGESHVQFNNVMSPPLLHDRFDYISDAIVAGLKIKF